MTNTDSSTAQEGEEQLQNEDDQARERSLQLGGGVPLGGAFKKYFGYITEVRDEMRKVTWPTRRMVVTETVVVIFVLVFFFALLYALDHLYAFVFNWLLFGKTS
ncbi:MAG TPA: preprotein translocase subunit SecE [Oscillatoriaceae cyanobacterium]